ncbi:MULTISPECIES: hypothetical protein [Rheinheimera]|uniref:Uncharacterized protein n=1 Tax=Rheinheimera marina TaxID=1774958 RepID=A0ABV9JQ75_9GAMM
MLVLLFACLGSAVACYIAALRSGMAARRWALAALCFGPLILPFFHSHKRLTLKRAYASCSRFLC